VIPTIAINRKLKGNSSLNIGWTQRIKRPGINKLNPFVDRSNPNMESTGNPGLQPALINTVQLGYNRSKKLSLTIGLSYDIANKLDTKVTSVDTTTNIGHTTFENAARFRRLATDYSVNYPITKQWNCSLNGSVAYFWARGIADNTWIQRHWLVGSFNLSSAYRFNKGWRTNANLSFNSRNPSSLQATGNAFARCSFGVNKEVIKDKLSFAASVSNPFTARRNNQVETIGGYFTEISNTAEYFRSFNLSVNYSFGKLKEAIRKNKRGIKNDDGGSGGN
jgi:hypothetical protein